MPRSGTNPEILSIVSRLTRWFSTSTVALAPLRGDVGGSGGSGGRDPTNTITIVPSSIDGEPGEEIDVTVSSDPSAVVVIDSGDLDDDDFSRLFGTTPFDITIVLPDEEGEYDFSAEAPEYTSDSATVTVEAELGTLSITAIGTPSAGRKPLALAP